jgi:hypothetical protein
VLLARVEDTKVAVFNFDQKKRYFQNRKQWMRQEGEEMLKWLSDLMSLDDFITDKLKKRFVGFYA